MEILTHILLTQIDDRQTAELLAILFVAIAAFIFIFGLMLLGSNLLDPVRSRYLRGGNKVILEIGDQDSNINVYQKYQHILLPNDEELISRTAERLHHAGFHYRKNLYQYFSCRLLLMVLFPVFVLIIMLVFPAIKLNTIFQMLIFAVVLGFIGPSFVLDYIIKKRQKVIQRAFPDALDLLVVCTEAGLGLDAAIQKVTSEIGFSHPVLANELSLVVAEIRAGIDRKIAFTGLANRTGVEAIRGLMSSINQSMRFGSSIAETLRIYSDDFRDKRMQEAEEKAATIGSKLIFPTALCLLPCFIMIIIVPFGMNLIKVFKDM